MKKYILLLIVPFLSFGQCIQGDCNNGYGTYVFSDGAKYTGEFKNYNPNGLGTYNLANGDIYMGEMKDNMIETWDKVKNSITDALQKVAIWFMFKPKELGLLLEQKWVETKGAFMEKLASLAGTISSLPAQLKLGLLESLKGTWLGDKFISDERIAEAQAEVASGAGFKDAMVAEVQSNTQMELNRIRKDRIALEMQKMQMERAATTVIQQNTGGATVNTTNISQGGGQVADPRQQLYGSSDTWCGLVSVC